MSCKGLWIYLDKHGYIRLARWTYGTLVVTKWCLEEAQLNHNSKDKRNQDRKLGGWRDGSMARALDPEHPLVLEIQVMWPTTSCEFLCKVSNSLFWPPQAPMHLCHIHTHKQECSLTQASSKGRPSLSLRAKGHSQTHPSIMLFLSRTYNFIHNFREIIILY